MTQVNTFQHVAMNVGNGEWAFHAPDPRNPALYIIQANGFDTMQDADCWGRSRGYDMTECEAFKPKITTEPATNQTTRPTIVRSAVAVESATDRGYTPETAPNATVCVELLAKGLNAIGWPQRGTIEYTRLRTVCRLNGFTIQELSNAAHNHHTTPQPNQ